MEAAIQAWADARWTAARKRRLRAAADAVDRPRRAEPHARRRRRGLEGRALPASNLIAFYDFKEGTGTRRARHQRRHAGDGPHAATRPTLDVELRHRDRDAACAIAPREASRKLYDRIADADRRHAAVHGRGLGHARPTSPRTDPARIVTYSASSGARNFTLGQALYSYRRPQPHACFPRVSGNGSPALQTADADRDAQAHAPARRRHLRPVPRPAHLRGRRASPSDVDELGPRAALELEPEPPLRARQRAEQRPAVEGPDPPASRSTSTRSPTRRSSRTSTPASASACCCASTSAQWTGAGTLHRVHGHRARRLQLPVLPADASSPEPNGVASANIRIAVNGAARAVSGQGFADDRHAWSAQTAQQLSPQCSIIPKDAAAR